MQNVLSQYLNVLDQAIYKTISKGCLFIYLFSLGTCSEYENIQDINNKMPVLNLPVG